MEVNDIQAVVAELRRREVRFEEVDVPGLRTVDGIAEVEGNYPSTGVGERAAWFRDSEGNLLGIGRRRVAGGHPGGQGSVRGPAPGRPGRGDATTQEVIAMYRIAWRAPTSA